MAAATQSRFCLLFPALPLLPPCGDGELAPHLQLMMPPLEVSPEPIHSVWTPAHARRRRRGRRGWRDSWWGSSIIMCSEQLGTYHLRIVAVGRFRFGTVRRSLAIWRDNYAPSCQSSSGQQLDASSPYWSPHERRKESQASYWKWNQRMNHQYIGPGINACLRIHSTRNLPHTKLLEGSAILLEHVQTTYRESPCMRRWGGASGSSKGASQGHLIKTPSWGSTFFTRQGYWRCLQQPCHALLPL